MQYREAYQWGEQELFGAGISESRLDARLLLEYVCGTDRNTLLVHGNREISLEEEEGYRRCISLRRERIPLQHITGLQEFMGLTFLVNKDVLIPRQDTEILVEEAMRFQKDGDRILDICTGSGCILLSLMHYSNHCTGVGTDISPEALVVAEENLKRVRGLSRPVPWEDAAVRLIQSDLFSHIPEERFDMIVSNPPYIETGAIPLLMEEVREHDPLLALDGKEDGLFFYRRIIAQSGKYLARAGRLFLEIGCSQAKAVSELMEEAGYREIMVVRDLAGLDRVVHGILI